MKSREFGTWRPRNVFGPERQKLYDEYNRSFKKARPPQPKEYASSDIEEYYHVPATKDVSGNPYDKRTGDQSKQAKKKADQKAKMRQQMLRQVAGIVAGASIIVTTYQTMTEQQNAVAEAAVVVEPDNNVAETGPQTSPGSSDVGNPSDQAPDTPSDQTPDTPSGQNTDTPSGQNADTPSGQNTDTPSGQDTDTPSGQDTDTPDEPDDNVPAGLAASWNWSEDRHSAVLVLSDESGSVIKELPATVTVSETAATCNQEGQKKYTAAVADDDNQYSDEQIETQPALGHVFGEGEAAVLENGNIAMTFECTRCHEHFTIEISTTESD